jgi:CelD/BcsL family acetyltransferase involved in cellulose biosynthesis
VKVEVLDSLEAVGPGAWDALVAGARLRSPFLGWTWQREWARVFADGQRIEVRRVVDAGGRLVALLPLHAEAPGRLALLGGADVSDYLDLIALEGREEEAWSALLHARAADHAVWTLHAVPAASPTVRVLPGLADGAGLAVDTALEERCPVLDLPGSWDAYLASLSGKHRHEMTRKLRRFAREEPAGRAVCVEGSEVEARLGDFLDLHRRSRAGKARFMDARMERFFRAAIPALASRGAARLWFLDLPAGPVAAFVTLEWDGVVGLYNSGFRPERASLSPGLVLLAHLVQDAIARGRRRFDFLRGEERYKFEFGPVPEDVYAVTVRPAS